MPFLTPILSMSVDWLLGISDSERMCEKGDCCCKK